MGMFDNVVSSDDVQQEKDSIHRGFSALPSDLYKLAIKKAYVTKAKSGAVAVNIVFATAEGKEIRMQEYVLSGDAKGNKNYYEKDGIKYFLPGYNQINALALLTVGKELPQLKTEKQKIMLYSYDAGQEVATEVDVFTELTNKVILAGVLHTIEDKTKKDDNTGKYEPTGETREINTIDKFFHPESKKTVAEIKGKADAVFVDKWVEAWKDKINDTSTKDKQKGEKGLPEATNKQDKKENPFM